MIGNVAQASQQTQPRVSSYQQNAARSFWTNPSVTNFSQGENPITVVTERARQLVFTAMEAGWEGPPFDPFWLAGYCKLPITARDDIPDARLVPESSGVRIEFNPNQPRARVRFSVAHEIAHTLFPDYHKSIRNREGATRRGDDWQLEMLCNIAAAEILVPPIPALSLGLKEISVLNLLPVWKQFEVSPEAFLLRIVKLTNQPISIFAAAHVADDSKSGFRLDYCIPSSSSPIQFPSGLMIPNQSVLSECTAIGYTAERAESWSKDGAPLSVECIGVPPYPHQLFPRVIGIVRLNREKQVEPLDVQSVYGDVTEPRGDGHKIIAHIVNDKTPNWGAGAALAIAKRWSSVQEDFRKWAITDRQEFRLGNIRESSIDHNLSVVSMVAQHGYGASSKPLVRYKALEACLSKLATIAKRSHSSVHMPRIGTGFAGGSWDVVEELVRHYLTGQGIKAVVYLLPRGQRTNPQHSIHSFSPIIPS
jgi:O-acetyl-ADP-ribose deacetylase (regulator of RNase III)